jgi:hypothetical protein
VPGLYQQAGEQCERDDGPDGEPDRGDHPPAGRPPGERDHGQADDESGSDDRDRQPPGGATRALRQLVEVAATQGQFELAALQPFQQAPQRAGQVASKPDQPSG